MTEPNWSLAALIAPMAWESFLADHWQQVPLHVPGAPDRFQRLVGLRDVDHLISVHCGRHYFPLTVVGGRLDNDETDSAGHSQWTAERVQERIRKGATVRIGNTKAYLPEIRRLSACFERELSSDIAINLYLTPPRSRAFGAHYDNHDVIILQVEGEKLWRLREPAAELPLEVMFRGRETWLRRALPYETSLKTMPPTHSERELRLCAGDLLYVPRGHVHEVMTGDRASLHLTVAAPVVTWYEVAVHALIAAARRSPTLRTALPPGFATDAATRARLGEAAPHVLAALAASLKAEDLTDSLETLADLFVYSRDGDWFDASRDMMRSDGISTDTRLAVRRGLACAVRVFGPDLILLFAGRSLQLPVRAESMVRHIVAERRFRVGELPTHLGDDSRLVLARMLVEKGLLTFADDG